MGYKQCRHAIVLIVLQVVVRVENNMQMEGLTIHWHGMRMLNTPWMDGFGKTQCPIMPGQSFEYRFLAEPAGTHFYHHHFGQGRRHGLYGMLIIHKYAPTIPEFTAMVYDWYQDDGATSNLKSPSAPVTPGTGETFNRADIRDYGADGSEVSLLAYVSSAINGRGGRPSMMLPREIFTVEQHATYRFRIASPAAERAYEISIDLHILTMVAMDGQEMEPVDVNSFIIASGQTMDFQFTASQAVDSYWLRAVTLRAGISPNVTSDDIVNSVHAIIRYRQQPALTADPDSDPEPCRAAKHCLIFNCPFAGLARSLFRDCFSAADATTTESKDYLDAKFGLKSKPDAEHWTNFAAMFGPSINARQFVPPPEPFYQAGYLDSLVPCTAECDEVGCRCTHLIDLTLGETVRIIVINIDPTRTELEHHPIHIHGHEFVILKMGYPSFDPVTGLMDGNNEDVECMNALCSVAKWRTDPPDLNLVNPPIVDTVFVPGGGYTIIQLKADNPGFWPFHCHILSHGEEGMFLVLREAPDHIPPVPPQFPICRPEFTLAPSLFDAYCGKQFALYLRTSTHARAHARTRQARTHV